MANPHRGQVAIRVGDINYTLAYSINALCELEEIFDKPIGEITEELGRSVSMKSVRSLVWVGLQENHPDVDEHMAGTIISEVGVQEMVNKVGEAFRLAFPQEVKSKANPRKAKGSAH